MIRSLSYAAQFVLNRLRTTAGTESDTLARWARAWQNVASARFLHADREVLAADRDLLPSPEQSQTLLDAFLLEKALYELLYELNNRPAWLGIPISGILSL